MKYLKIIGISLIVSVIVSIGILAYVYNYVSLFPVKILDERGERMLGVSVTELSGTDTMSGFPTVYNANLNSLNDGKMEISTTTLPLLSTLLGLNSVGTIGTGVWEGTAITVAYQGTGTTSPTLNQIILGNASSGFKVVSGFGASGQFLTSGGSGAVPTWTTSAIDTAIAYDWTGEHTWSATSTMATTTIDKLTVSGDTILNSLTLNGVLADDLVGGFTNEVDDLHFHQTFSLVNGVGTSTKNKLYTVFTIPFVSSLWTESNLSGPLYYGGAFFINPGSDAKSSLQTTTYIYGDIGSSNNKFRFNTDRDVIVQFDLELKAVGTEEQGFGLGETGTAWIGDYDDNTDDSVAFTVDASGNLYAHTANRSVASTETQITGITLTDVNTYRIEWNPGVSARFYVNGVLKATNTTNLPVASTEIYFAFGAGGDTNTNGIMIMSAPNFAIEKN